MTYNRIGIGWEKYELEIPVGTRVDEQGDPQPVSSFDLRIGMPAKEEQPIGAQAVIDDVSVRDNLQWLAEGVRSADPPIIQIEHGGIMRLDGEPFMPQAIWYGHKDTSPCAIKRDFLKLGSRGINAQDVVDLAACGPIQEEDGRGLNTIMIMTGRYYASKRQLRMMLDAAYSLDLHAIVQLPIFPYQPTGDTWPKQRLLVRDWVRTFGDHPALIAWNLSDELNARKLFVDCPAFPVTQWIRELEAEEGLPFRPTIAITMGALFDNAYLWSDGLCTTTFDCITRGYAAVADIVAPHYTAVRDCRGKVENHISAVVQSTTSAIKAGEIDPDFFGANPLASPRIDDVPPYGVGSRRLQPADLERDLLVLRSAGRDC